MKPKYPYALYLDSKILGTATQLLSFFEQEIFSRDNTIIYLKRYKESATAFQKIFERARIPYQFMRPSELDQLSGQIIFYAFNAQSNCRLVANRKLKHVFITHGESNKVSSIKPIIRIYDHVTMAGQLSLERYYKSGLFDEDDYEKGRLILVGDTFIGRTGFSQSTKETPVIFYAPTWEGGLATENYSSLKNIELVKTCLLQASKQLNTNRVVIQPHPNLGYRAKKYLNNLIELMLSLRKSEVEIYFHHNEISINFIQKIKTQRSGIKMIEQSHFKNFYATHAFVDISAIESQCINELIPYLSFYDENNLREDIPSIYLDRYKKIGIDINRKEVKLNINQSNYGLFSIKYELFNGSQIDLGETLEKRIILLESIIMSKLTKLVNNPKLFFKDFFYKRLGNKKNKMGSLQSISKINLDVACVNPCEKIVHIIHSGEGMMHGPSHLNIWVPHFLKNGNNFMVLVRNHALFNWMKKKYPSINAAYARRAIDVEGLLMQLTYVKAFYYLSNTGNLIHSLRYNNYKHIFLGHGDSDKAASAHKFFRVYDEIWVAGQAHIDRFKNANFETKHMKFVKVGRPNMLEVLLASDTPWENRFPDVRVLYIPTWEGVYEENNYSSARLSVVMLSELQKKFGVYLSAKFHPVTGSRNKLLENIDDEVSKALAEVGANFYVASKEDDLSRLIIDSNVFICDISAVVSECIAANGPIFVYIPSDKEIVKSNSNLDYSDYAYVFSSIDELFMLFEQVVIKGDDYLAEQRLKARDYLLSVKETCEGSFLTQLQWIQKDEA